MFRNWHVVVLVGMFALFFGLGAVRCDQSTPPVVTHPTEASRIADAVTSARLKDLDYRVKRLEDKADRPACEIGVMGDVLVSEDSKFKFNQLPKRKD